MPGTCCSRRWQTSWIHRCSAAEHHQPTFSFYYPDTRPGSDMYASCVHQCNYDDWPVSRLRSTRRRRGSDRVDADGAGEVRPRVRDKMDYVEGLRRRPFERYTLHPTAPPLHQVRGAEDQHGPAAQVVGCSHRLGGHHHVRLAGAANYGVIVATRGQVPESDLAIEGDYARFHGSDGDCHRRHQRDREGGL